MSPIADGHDVPAGRRLPGVEYVTFDGRTPGLAAVLAEHAIDTVVHLAAIVTPGPKSNRELEYSVDVLGTRNVLEACIGSGVLRIVVSSSGAAYGYYADNPAWLTEDHPVRGNEAFAYSHHKRLVEEMLAEYRRTHPALEQVVFRVGTILGETTRNQITALFERPRLLAIRGSASPFVFIWDRDVARAIEHAIFGVPAGIYNVAGDGALGIREIAARLGKRCITLPPGLLRDYHLQRYVAWVKRTLTPQTGPKVIVHTFADFDPTDGTPFYSPFGALYSAGDPAKIVLGTEFSRYEFRDGAYDDEFGGEAPENGEWHEYNHHLWFTFVDTAAACVGENHAGYLNPDTCDSMLEGFANFLAAAAARDIGGATDSFYDGSWNIEAPLKAWSSNIHSDGTRIYEEDVAVAALLWDLHDDAPDKFPTAVIEEETGLHVEATYTDEHSESLVDLWARFTSAKPLTVDDLRVSYGTPDLSIDLDGDEFNDIAPIDQVFLMHGFFPIDHDETITSSHKTYHYDVNYVQRTAPTAARNAVVGWSSHRIFAANGSVLNTFIPRSHMPMDRNANGAVDIRDASGTPLGGAQLDVVIDYPGQQQNTSTRALAGGAGNLVSLRLPPYFDHLLPEEALPPPCDPATDQTVKSAAYCPVIS